MKDTMTERLLVEERCVRSVEARRVLVVEVPFGFRDQARLGEILRMGELDRGPFQFEIVPSTEHLETRGLDVLGVTEEPVDIPWQEDEYQKGCGITTNGKTLFLKAGG